MALDIPVGWAHASVQILLSSMPRSAYCTFGVGDGVGTFPAGSAEAVRDAWIAAFDSVLDSNAFTGTVTLRIGTSGDPLVQDSTTAINPGAHVGNASPPSVAALFSKRTARGGRRGRGRMFVPWILDVDQVGENGVIIPSAVTSFQTAANLLLTELAAADMPMALLHNEGPPEPGPPDPVTALTAESLIASQRRRLGR